MTTLQKYLERKHPTKEDKEKVKDISVWRIKKDKGEQEKMEGGELDLSGYP